MARLRPIRLDERNLTSLINNKDFRTRFPKIAAAIRRQVYAYNTCCKSATLQQAKLTKINNIKQTIATMPAGQIAALKKLLNTDQLIIQYRDRRKIKSVSL